MRGQGRLAGLIAVTCLALAANAQARGPQDFFGVVANGPLVSEDYPRMQAGGVGKLRFLLSWREVQPAPEVLDWSRVDAVVGGARDDSRG